MDKKTKNSLVKILALAIIMISVFFLFSKLKVNDYGPSDIKNFILSKGNLGPVVYIILLTLLPLVLFPDSVLVIGGGMVYGLVWGTILTSIGSLLGGIIAFMLSRKLGRDFVKKITKKDLVMFKEDNKLGGFFVILMLRLIPLFPFKVVSYSAGLSNIKLKDFSIATVIGSLPGIIVYTNLGDKTNNVGSAEFYKAIIILIALFVVSFIIKKVVAMKNKNILKNKYK
ncbi:Uncharacterized membrane protein YdjX, TVP38/TMEM64 family, SNARE-associated domain [Hathewaya proteolytica DSM 3090]|uniref:TVP38/TMEM64 family membrane protein n=1 Tax=Hathewaya proteolytica DSM 3090 TaxID=1121331 RepID=A0A1M6KGR2_9CLOT|nr:TVP38/TMEM64 family protein [Hathewaya proteolytica]SHJ58129.1 Uncharacterized membrane protein YdjX, TVP38/TMEM64 family, SNARE-associated domain [Hathewaya proteolytica DSM 3090]